MPRKHTAVIVAAALLLALGIAGCKQLAKGNDNAAKYTVTVPATIKHGKLTVSPAVPEG